MKHNTTQHNKNHTFINFKGCFCLGFLSNKAIIPFVNIALLALLYSCSLSEIETPTSSSKDNFHGTPKSNSGNSAGFYHNLMVGAVYTNGQDRYFSKGYLTEPELTEIIDSSLSKFARNGMDTTGLKVEIISNKFPNWITNENESLTSSISEAIEQYELRMGVSPEFSDTLRNMSQRFILNPEPVDSTFFWGNRALVLKDWRQTGDAEYAEVTWDFLQHSYMYWTNEGRNQLRRGLNDGSDVIIVDTIIGVAFSPFGPFGILMGGLASLAQNEGWV